MFGGALSRAVADHVVRDPSGGTAAERAHHTPDGLDDRTAATLTIAGRTASAALAVIDPGPGDTALIGGADATAGDRLEIARLVASGRLRVPIAATFPLEEIRRAAELQAGRHVHGAVVMDL